MDVLIILKTTGVKIDISSVSDAGTYTSVRHSFSGNVSKRLGSGVLARAFFSNSEESAT